jgi:uncharacterized RDD family membrane protein YckC
MTQTDDTRIVEERHFGRRLLAFLLDAVIASLIIALVFGAVQAVTGVDLGSPTFSMTGESTCAAAPADHPQVRRVEAMWPLSAGEKRENILCKITESGGEESFVFITGVVGQTEMTTYSSEASYPVDKNGQPLAVRFSIDWRPVANLLLFVAFTARGLRTPGKASMALRVVTDNGDKLGWGTAFAREALKFLPFLVYFASTAWFSVSPPALLSDSETILVTMRDGGLFTSSYAILFLAFGVGTAVWWTGPFLLWRGGTWYDAIAGTRLVRTDLPRATGRSPA